MFEALTPAAPDAIFGLTEAFRQDPRPEKVNLGAGVYKDAEGKTPIFAAVHEAEGRLLSTESSKSYLPIEGHDEYTRQVGQLLLGDGELSESGRAVTAQAPGGTGALRLAIDFLHRIAPRATVWLSDPTWPNHPQILDAVGMAQRSYPYFDPIRHALDFEAMTAALAQAAPGDVVLLHGCCHNPTGVDPTTEQWHQLADLMAERQLVPLVDFAYQGFAEGLRQDVAWLPILGERLDEILVANSFSKNFGLYNERVGGLTAITPSAERSAIVLGQLKRSARALYSNPPAHGALVVATILGDETLRQLWHDELESMRQRIRRLRRGFVDGLDHRGIQLAPGGNEFIARQNGMFSFSGLRREHVEWLKKERAIYLVGSGRVNIAGMREDSMDALCDAIAEALAGVTVPVGAA